MNYKFAKVVMKIKEFKILCNFSNLKHLHVFIRECFCNYMNFFGVNFRGKSFENFYFTRGEL
jgi:uncharacterized protein YjbI with pentapeptide repeats